MTDPGVPASRRVSVLLVSFDHIDEIDACLDAALAQADEDLEVEVVVVDNASRDGTAQRLRERGAAITLLARSRNAGFAAGVNQAFAVATGDDVALLNPDCVMDPGCLRELRVHLHSDPCVALAAALLRNPDGTAQRFARRDHGLLISVLALTDLGRRADARWLGGRGGAYRAYADRWPPVAPLAVDAPAAACVLVRRRDLGSRPLDPAFPLFFNDADLCRRLRVGGRRLEVVPRAGAVHGYGTSVTRAGRARPAALRAEWVVSLLRYTRRYWPLPAHLALMAVLLIDALATAALTVAGRGNLDLARGTLGALGVPGGVAPLLTGDGG